MEQQTGKKRVAVYCCTGVDGGPCNVLDAQKSYYTQKIENAPEWELAGFYADTDVKGRTEFNRMISACKRGSVDLIVTKSVSRFARNTVDAVKTVRLLKDMGVGVIFEKENINTLADTDADESGLLLTLFGHFAQEECKHITKNFIYPVGRRLL